MAGVSDLGLLKAAAGRGCVKKGFKKGMMGPPTEEVRLQRSQVPSPYHGGRFLASWTSSQGCLA